MKPSVWPISSYDGELQQYQLSVTITGSPLKSRTTILQANPLIGYFSYGWNQISNTEQSVEELTLFVTGEGFLKHLDTVVFIRIHQERRGTGNLKYLDTVVSTFIRIHQESEREWEFEVSGHGGQHLSSEYTRKVRGGTGNLKHLDTVVSTFHPNGQHLSSEYTRKVRGGTGNLKHLDTVVSTFHPNTPGKYNPGYGHKKCALLGWDDGEEEVYVGQLLFSVGPTLECGRGKLEKTPMYPNIRISKGYDASDSNLQFFQTID
ncbi:hypothetical protein STEG23_020185, partial [Scotinomys teguina]